MIRWLLVETQLIDDSSLR